MVFLKNVYKMKYEDVQTQTAHLHLCIVEKIHPAE